MGILSGGDSHKSNLTGLGEYFDPTSWFMPEPVNPHTYIKPGTDWLNENLSVISKPVNQFMTTITPGKSWVDDNIGIAQAWNDTVENRPVDAAGIVASLFGGGAASGAFSGGGAASLGTAGNAAANAALSGGSATGAGAATGAGIGTLGSAGTAYGANMLGSGLASAGTIAPSSAALAAGGGLGGLGVAGTTAATSALTPAFYSTGTATADTLGSYMSNLYDQAKEIKSYYDKGKTIYDLANPEQPYQQREEPMRITNPMADPTRYSMARYLRGY